jgi:tetratricopeptide (TPR) repeat protein
VRSVTAVRSARDAERIEALRERAAVCVERGQFLRAETLLLRALEILGPRRGRPSAEHLASWNELGIVCKYLGKFAKARNLYRSALFYCDSTLTGNARWNLLANLYHNLGGLEHSLRRFRQSEPHARKSVRYRLLVQPPNSVAIAADRVALAAILDGLGKFNESQKLYRVALGTYRRAFGKSHREIALVLNNLAAVEQKTGSVGRAEEMYRAALAMKIKELGSAHPDVAVTLNNLGMLLASEGRTAEAKSCFEKALRLLRKALGERHPSTRAVRANYQRHSKPQIARV